MNCTSAASPSDNHENPQKQGGPPSERRGGPSFFVYQGLWWIATQIAIPHLGSLVLDSQFVFPYRASCNVDLVRATIQFMEAG